MQADRLNKEAQNGSKLVNTGGTMKPCECRYWARLNTFPLTQHHPKCKHFKWEEETIPIIKRLLLGMEIWGADEDGIHPESWIAYKNAKAFIGEPLTKCTK